MAWRCLRLFSLAALVGLACIDLGEITAPGAVPGSLPLGAACLAPTDCREGPCVDGFCCNVAICPVCQVCGRTGRCGNVAAGDRDPPARCGHSEPAESCGKTGMCDGHGGCAYYPEGTICGAGTCNDRVVVNARTCNGLGECVPGATIVCAPFACYSGLCNARCTSDAGCLSGPCISGSCGKRVNGGRCGSGDECESGFCADGLCCKEACTGPCTSCSQRGSEGSCAHVAKGVFDPRGKCSSEALVTCGFDGTCNGGCATSQGPFTGGDCNNGS